MAIIKSIDITTRLIYLDVGVTQLNDLLAFWREYRGFRVANTDNTRLSHPIMTVIGGQSKGGGKYVGRIIDLDGYKIVPDDVDHSLDVTIEIIDSGNGLSGRNVFDRSGLVNNVNIDINIAPVEIVVVTTGGSSLTTEEHDKLMTGLDASIPPGVWDELRGEIVRKMLHNKVTKSGDIITIYEDDGTTVWKQFNLANNGRVEI